MLAQKISPIRLASYGPEILNQCQAVLAWLEQRELTDTLAYLKLRRVIHYLHEAGVEPGPEEEVAAEPVLPPDYALAALDFED